MKKIGYMLMFCVMSLFMIARVNAEVIDKGDDVYVFEDQPQKWCSNIEQDLWFYGMDSNNNYMVADNDDTDLYYWHKDNTCTKLTNQQVLDLNGEVYEEYFEDSETGKIYHTSTFISWNGYVLTSDKSFVTGKTYYNSEHMTVTDLDVLDINTYYEVANFVRPANAIIDDNLSYYTKSYNGGSYDTFTPVVNPVEEDILTYYVKATKPVKTETLFKTLDKEVLDQMKEEFIAENKGILGGYNVMVFNGKVYIYFDSFDGKSGPFASKTFDETLENEIVAFRDAILFSMDGDELISISTNDSKFKIFDRKFNLIKEYENSEQNYMVVINGIGYMELYEDDETIIKFIHVYNVKDGKNQTYKDKNLTITFNGKYDLLSKVKVNDEELETDKYTKEEGSTVITLKKEYLDTLKKGTYTLKVEYSDGGYASASFTVPEKNPETFDGIMTYILLAGISLIGITGSILYLKRRKV